MAYLFVPFPMTLENLEGHSPNAGLIKCAYTDRQLQEPCSRHRRLAANAGPRLWNDLPPGLRRPGLTFDSFRQSLKTHLFGDRSA